MGQKILVVDDAAFMRMMIKDILVKNGFDVVGEATDGAEAVDKYKELQPDLVTMDITMPEMDGIEACERIRKIPELSDTIITFLTARGEDYSQVAGFDAGADDYITKPIKPKVLVSKVKALLRRYKEEEEFASDVLKIGSLTIYREAYKIILKGKELILPRKEFELLSLLTSKPGKVFKREEILDKVWGNEVIVGGRTIDVHIRKLREKIGDVSFKTVKGVGYKFVD